MKISLNTIKWQGYEDIFKLPLNDLAEKIGAQLGALEEAPYYLGELYDGIVVAKVIKCEKHPNADKLTVCEVDNGSQKVQVVCGAPNVREGMLAAWIPPGMVVPATFDKDPFVLEVREIRGVESHGMLASAAELNIADDHSGLLEIKPEEVGEALAKPGTPFKNLFGLDDYILEIENKMFTHRPDCFGLLGVGREIAGIQQMAFKSPGWYLHNMAHLEGHNGLNIEVRNELTNEVPRFVAIPIEGVKVGPSPNWLRSLLARLGIKSINNIVDLTNYYMVLTGQPLHAYDYDKVKALSGGDGAVLAVRNPRPGEKVKLLNGKEVEPRPEAIMITTDKQAIGVGGIMGGSETEVDDNTTNIILEAATFDMYSIRRTGMAHGLFTDASTRFTKGQSPLQNLAVANQAALDIVEMAGGEIGQTIDDNHVGKAALERNSLFGPVTVSAGFINSRLGLELKPGEMKQLLENVEFEVDASGDELTVKAPFWRTDIELREDVVEEVGRLYGYDHLPLVLPKRDLTPTTRDGLLDLKAEVRHRLSEAGANEVLTYSFVSGELLDKAGQDQAKAYQVANALSPNLQYYRLSLMPSLLEKVHPNIKAGYDEFALFELGKIHSLELDLVEDVPQEHEYTGLVVTAADKLKKQGSAYYQAQRYLQNLVKAELAFKPIDKSMAGYQVVQPYNPDRSALVSYKDGDFLGIIGELKPSVSRALKLPKYTAGFEVDTTVLQTALSAPAYAELSRYPKVSQDLSLKVGKETTYQQVFDVVNKQFTGQAPANTNLYVPQPIDIYRADDGSRHLAFRFTLAAQDRTLTDKEVAKVLDAVAAAAKQELGAERL